MKTFRMLITFLFLTGLLLSACARNTPTESATATATTTPTLVISAVEFSSPPTPMPTLTAGEERIVTAEIGANGGSITTADGLARLTFPKNSLNATAKITISARGARPEDGGVISPVYEISLEPGLQKGLVIAAMLTFLDPAVTDSGQAGFARLMTYAGKASDLDNQVMEPFQFWMPQGQSSINENGTHQVWLAKFSPYAVVQLSNSQCQPTAKDLTPPPTPPGYVYLGVEVMNNFVLDRDLSTTPMDRPDPQVSGEIAIVTRNDTLVNDFTTACDLVVVHIFVPQPSENVSCIDSLEDLKTAPEAPYGYRYVGYDVLSNFALVESTVPDDYIVKSNDLIRVNSQTKTTNGLLTCDSLVGHVFENLNLPSPPSEPGTTSKKALVKADVPANGKVELSTDGSGNIILSFPPKSIVDWANSDLSELAKDKIIKGTDGSATFILPPGTEVHHAEGEKNWYILLGSTGSSNPAGKPCTIKIESDENNVLQRPYLYKDQNGNVILHFPASYDLSNPMSNPDLNKYPMNKLADGSIEVTLPPGSMGYYPSGESNMLHIDIGGCKSK